MTATRTLFALRPTPSRHGAALVWCAIVISGAVGMALAAPRLVFKAHDDSTVRIVGRATLGEWACEMRNITAVVEPGPILEAIAALVAGGKRVASGETPAETLTSALPRIQASKPYANITIPVASLRCDKPAMRADVLRALKAQEAPLIVFVLTGISDVQLRQPGAGELARYQLVARGDLILAGVLRPIEVAAEVRQTGPTRFVIGARQQVTMSEFAITPPTALFGLIRADNNVSVIFNLRFDAVGLKTDVQCEGPHSNFTARF